MARTLSSGMNGEIGRAVTTPAYLVEIQFAMTLRISSRGTVFWNGNSWVPRGLTVRGVGYDVGSPQQTGLLTIIDSDLEISALVLGEGIAGRPINIWKFYGTAPAPTDPVQIFAGIGNGAAMTERSATVEITLAQRGATELYSPRRYMTRSNGFSILPVAGRIVTFNAENWKLERNRG